MNIDGFQEGEDFFYSFQPDLYVSNILMRGGPGSLISVLQERKLCNFIKTHYNVSAGLGLFMIKCEIARNTEIREDDIVELIIQVVLEGIIFLVYIMAGKILCIKGKNHLGDGRKITLLFSYSLYVPKYYIVRVV